MFDRLYNLGDLTSPPMKNVQTVSVPPGGATMVEFKVDVPGKLVIGDHALSRMKKGLVGFINVKGPENPKIFHSSSEMDPSSGH